MSCDMDKLCHLLDEKNMTNKDHYKHVIRLSHKLKYQISQLKMKNRTVQLDPTAVTNIQKHPHSTASRRDKDSNSLLLLLQKSPTETLMTYYDTTTTTPSANVHINNKPLLQLPPLSPELGNNKGVHSPPHFIILQTHKKYNTIFHHLQGTYQLDHLTVYSKSMAVSSPYMVASRDTRTGEKRMVLKLVIHMTTPTELTIAFPPKKKKRKKKKQQDYEILLHDQTILNQLDLFISQQQPLLPLLVHAIHIFRDAYNLYVVYPHFNKL